MNKQWEMINQPLRGRGISWEAVGEAFGSSGTEGGVISVLSLALCIASAHGSWCAVWGIEVVGMLLTYQCVFPHCI